MQLKKTSLQTQGFFISSLLLATSVQPAFAAPVPAKSADAFVDSIGVNVHLTYSGTPYEKFEDLIKPKLKELGIRHIRDGAYQDEDFFKKIKNLADTGIKTTLIFSGNPPNEVVATAKKLAGAIKAVEGPNESDLEIFNFVYKGDKFPEGTRNYQKEMYAAVKGDPVTKNLPVVLPSMGWGENADKIGKLSAGDYCNIHSYPNIGQAPTIDLDSYFIPHIHNMCSYHLPKWVTETGYHNTISNELGISEQAAGKYIPRLLLGNFKRNIERTYLYELINQGTDLNDDQSNFGLLRFDGSPKPAFTVIKNMTSLLREPGVKFTPQSLDYETQGDKQGIETVLLQKSNGDYYLIFWQETKSWDNDSKKDITVPSKKITVSLKKSANKLEVYDPIKSTSAAEVISNAKTIEISIPDHPVILRVATSSTQASIVDTQKPNSNSIDNKPDSSTSLNKGVINQPETKPQSTSADKNLTEQTINNWNHLMHPLRVLHSQSEETNN